MDKWLTEFFEVKTDSPDEGLVVEVLWQIWKYRNHHIFRDRKPKTEAIMVNALAQSRSFKRWRKPEAERWNRNTKNRTTAAQNSPTSWTAPKGGNLKLNIDCSWVEGEFASSVAGLLRNSSGVIVEGFAKAIHASSPLQAETLAVLHGLRLLKKENDTHVGQVQESKKSLVCETDCRTVVESIMGRTEAPWAVKDLIQECQQILAQVPHAKLTHCSRDANYAADWVAKAFRLKTLPSGWQIESLQPLWNNLCSDFNLSFPCNSRNKE